MENIFKEKIIWIAAAVVVLGGIWYFFPSSPNSGGEATVATSTKPSGTTSTQQTTKPSIPRPATGGSVTTQKPASSVKVAGVNTLAYLYSLKEPLVCSVSMTAAGVKRSGTMYVADAHMRVDFASTSMIDDGSYLYVWVHGAAKGTKLSSTLSVSGSVIASNGGFDTANPFSFTCNAWTKDASVFAPPASVSF